MKNGGFIAAIASGPDAPATWNTYLNVADVDAAAARVEQGGGTLLTPPQDAGGEARVAFAADPAGATFGLWQAGAHIGATVVNEEGAFIWSELGGTVVRGPVVTPVGPIAALLDPQGGAFSVWEFSGTTK